MSELADIYRALADLQRSTGRIEEAVVNIKSAIVDRQTEHDDLASRVQKIENRESFASGKSTIISSIAGIIFGGLAAWIGRHLP